MSGSKSVRYDSSYVAIVPTKLLNVPRRELGKHIGRGKIQHLGNLLSTLQNIFRRLCGLSTLRLKMGVHF